MEMYVLAHSAPDGAAGHIHYIEISLPSCHFHCLLERILVPHAEECRCLIDC